VPACCCWRSATGATWARARFSERRRAADEVLSAFVSQYYAEQTPPAEIVLDREIPDAAMLAEALSTEQGRKVVLKWNVRGERAGYVDLARQRGLRAAHRIDQPRCAACAQRSMRELLGLSEPVKRVECFDISHTMGEATVASCVVFDAAGPVRNLYRRFNIAGITPGDDYAAMHQALERRFRHAVEHPDSKEWAVPDAAHRWRRGATRAGQGGAGDLGVQGVMLVGVAKGEERRAGHEALVMPDGRELRPGAGSRRCIHPAGARRSAPFAITGHRGRRPRRARPVAWKTSRASARVAVRACSSISAGWPG
jgi:excinuclease ABC subunit C